MVTQISTQGFTAAESVNPLSVVVLNWNQPDDTCACVRSLLASSVRADQIIVVDNGSTDGSVEVLQAQFGAAITLVALPHNQGFAAGMNAGMAAALAAGAAAVLLLNNDTLVAPDMLRELRAAAEALPGGGAFGPAIYYHAAPTRLWQIGARRHAWVPFPVNVGDGALRRAQGQPLPLDYLTGCALLVRRSVIEQVGMFDLRYRFYFEDADFSRRIAQAGFTLWGVPRARMWHRVALSAKTIAPATRYTFAWGRGRFYRMHPHGPLAGLTLAFLLISTIRSMVRHWLRGEAQLAQLVWRGTRDGYTLREPCGPWPG